MSGAGPKTTFPHFFPHNDTIFQKQPKSRRLTHKTWENFSKTQEVTTKAWIKIEVYFYLFNKNILLK